MALRTHGKLDVATFSLDKWACVISCALFALVALQDMEEVSQIASTKNKPKET